MNALYHVNTVDPTLRAWHEGIYTRLITNLK